MLRRSDTERLATTPATLALPLALVAFVALGPGCAGPAGRVGPDLGPMGGVDALAQTIRERKGRIRSLYSPATGMRLAWVQKGRSRSARLRADMYLAGEDQLRLEIKHAILGMVVGTVIVSEGEFYVENPRKFKGYEGVVMEVVKGRFPDAAIRAEDMRAWLLFFPALGGKSGERSAVTELKGQHIIEFWDPPTAGDPSAEGKPGHAPTRRLWVSSWSHAPLKIAFYGKDGSVATEIEWSDFSWLEKEKLVFPRGVTVKVPGKGFMARFSLSRPQFNKAISEEAFELLPSPGFEVEEVKPKPKPREPS